MKDNKFNRTAQQQDALMAELWCAAWNSFRAWGWKNPSPDGLRRAFQIARRWYFA